MNKMSLDDKFEVGESGETLKFVVKSTDPRHANNATSSPSSSGSSSTSSAGGSGSGTSGAGGLGAHCAFVCHGLNAESTGEWVETIREILQKQRDFLKAIQSPIKYQNEQQRLSSSGHTTQHL
jgi:triple functional domain protein